MIDWLIDWLIGRFCFKCGNDYHAPTDCETIKRWLTKCADDSETANYISAHTKVVIVFFNFSCLTFNSTGEFTRGAQYFVAVDCIIEPGLLTFCVFRIILKWFWILIQNIYCNCTTVQNRVSFAVFFLDSGHRFFLHLKRSIVFVLDLATSILNVSGLETSIFTYCFGFWDSGRDHIAMDPEPCWLPYVVTSNSLCRTARNATSASRRTADATTCSASTASTSSAGCVWGTGAPTVQNTTNAQGQLEISWIAIIWMSVSNTDQALPSFSFLFWREVKFPGSRLVLPRQVKKHFGKLQSI